jgi:hypothetical protein
MTQISLESQDGGSQRHPNSNAPSISRGGPTPGFLGLRFAMALAGLAGLGALALDAEPASSASAIGTGNATIIVPITIAATANLEFGKLAAGTGVSVVRIDTAGARSLVSGDTTLVTGGTEQAASFDVTGEASQGYAITLPAGAATLTSGANTMTVDTFTSSVGASSTLSVGGTETFTVGGDLNVGIAQAVGTYTGTFTVTVNYN